MLAELPAPAESPAAGVRAEAGSVETPGRGASPFARLLAQLQAPADLPAPGGREGVGLYLTPVPGAPFSALVWREITRNALTGQAFHEATSAFIARDSRGRIHNELRQAIRATDLGDPALVRILLYDPTTGTGFILYPSSHFAEHMILPQNAPAVPPTNWAQHKTSGGGPAPNVRDEDLGSNDIEGFLVHGYRRTRTIPANLSGTGKPVDVVDEYWYSDQLRLNLIQKHNDPRTGSVALTVMEVKAQEPATDLFEVHKVGEPPPPEPREPQNSIPALR
jgi:hypothetical protein